MSTSTRPRRKTTDRRPGLIDAPKKRRTKAEIQEEEEHATAAANTKRQTAELTHSSAVGRVATKEDEMQREDKEASL